MKISSNLITAVKSRQVVAFVGAGLSVAAGGPTWMELVYGLLSEAEASTVPNDRLKLFSAYNAICQGRLINAATILATLMTSQNVKNCIVDQIENKYSFNFKNRDVSDLKSTNPICEKIFVKNRAKQVTNCHDVLLGLDLKAIVTTNYDKIFEKALVSRGRSIASYSNNDKDIVSAIKHGKQFILNLHGDIDHQNDIVISWKDYLDTIAENAILIHLKNLFSTSTVLWIGYSHSDIDVDLVMVESIGMGSHGGFQVVLEDDYELIAKCKCLGIDIIPIASYDALPDFCNELASKCGLSQGPSPLNIPESIESLNEYSMKITNFFIASNMQSFPDNYFRPVIKEKNAEYRLIENNLFEKWYESEENSGGNSIAIIAQPGIGKTLLLMKYAQWIHDQKQSSQLYKSDLYPLVIYLTPANVPVNIVEDSIWNYMEEREEYIISGYYKSSSHQIIERHCKKKLVYLLFDGLDEFGSRRRGELELFMKALLYLKNEKKVNIFITCRKVFWDQQIKNQKEWEIFGIMPLGQNEVEGFVHYPNLGYFAYDLNNKPKSGIMNPQLIMMVLTLLTKEKNNFAPCKTRFELYEKWAQFSAEREGDRNDISPTQLLELFDKTATELVKELAVSVPTPKLSNGSYIPLHKSTATGILKISSDRQGVTFAHETINEFFVARVLKESFLKVLEKGINSDDLLSLPLAEVDLDFLQATVYGFLFDQLGPDYISKLVLKLNRITPDKMNKKEKYLRNLLEYIGMTYTGNGDYKKVVNSLLSLMSNNKIDAVSRYNAARALERIHSWAPRPYFDLMSDWGDNIWAEARNQIQQKEFTPWAIRGYRIKSKTGEIIKRKPGRYPGMSLIKSSNIDMDLQREVSHNISILIDELLKHPYNNAMLLINCSHTWIRWFHKDHENELISFQEKTRAFKDDYNLKPLFMNLSEWVGNEKFQP